MVNGWLRSSMNASSPYWGVLPSAQRVLTLPSQALLATSLPEVELGAADQLALPGSAAPGDGSAMSGGPGGSTPGMLQPTLNSCSVHHDPFADWVTTRRSTLAACAGKVS